MQPPLKKFSVYDNLKLRFHSLDFPSGSIILLDQAFCPPATFFVVITCEIEETSKLIDTKCAFFLYRLAVPRYNYDLKIFGKPIVKMSDMMTIMIF